MCLFVCVTATLGSGQRWSEQGDVTESVCRQDSEGGWDGPSCRPSARVREDHTHGGRVGRCHSKSALQAKVLGTKIRKLKAALSVTAQTHVGCRVPSHGLIKLYRKYRWKSCWIFPTFPSRHRGLPHWSLLLWLPLLGSIIICSLLPSHKMGGSLGKKDRVFHCFTSGVEDQVRMSPESINDCFDNEKK